MEQSHSCYITSTFSQGWAILVGTYNKIFSQMSLAQQEEMEPQGLKSRNKT